MKKTNRNLAAVMEYNEKMAKDQKLKDMAKRHPDLAGKLIHRMMERYEICCLVYPAWVTKGRKYGDGIFIYEVYKCYPNNILQTQKSTNYCTHLEAVVRAYEYVYKNSDLW